jgi:hypothetical protein
MAVLVGLVKLRAEDTRPVWVIGYGAERLAALNQESTGDRSLLAAITDTPPSRLTIYATLAEHTDAVSACDSQHSEAEAGKV